MLLIEISLGLNSLNRTLINDIYLISTIMMSFKNKFNQGLKTQKKYFSFNVSNNVLREVSRDQFLSLHGSVVRMGSANLVKVLGASSSFARKHHISNKILTTLRGESLEGFYSSTKQVLSGLSVAIKVLHTLGESSAKSDINLFKVVEDNGANLLNIVLTATSLLMKWQRCAEVGYKKDFKFFIEILLDIVLIYTNTKLVLKEFTAESLDNLLLTSASYCLPEKLINFIKRFNLFTSVKLLDDHQLLVDFYGHIIDAVDFVLEKFPIPYSFKLNIKSLLNCLKIGKHYMILHRIEHILGLLVKDKALIREITFRKAVLEINTELQLDTVIPDMKRRSESVATLLVRFKQLVLQVSSYEESSRIEPICIILEGAPGCGKSVFMNQLVEVLDRPVYCHSIKSVMDGKDWYDSYNYEDIFTMDDVGQQGISQWRTIINMVSSVKLPLDCAEASLKRTKFFKSEILLMTTNCFTNLNGLSKNDCISDIHALWRRGFVFDFDAVKFVDGVHQGVCKFRYYDLETRTFISGFPPHLAKFLSDKGINITSNLILEQDSSKFLEWAAIIVTALNTIQRERHNNSVVSNSIKNLIKDKLSKISLAYPEKFFDAESYGIDFFMRMLRSAWQKEMLGTLSIELISMSEVVRKNFTFSQSVVLKFLLGWILTIGFSYLFSVMRDWLINKPNFNCETSVENVLKTISGSQVEVDLRIPRIQKNILYVKLYQSGEHIKNFGIFSGRHVIVPSHGIPLDEGVLDASVYEDFSQLELDKIPFKVKYRNREDDVCVLSLPKYFARPFKSLKSYLGVETKECGVLWLLSTNYKVYLSSHLRSVRPGTVYSYGKLYSNVIGCKDVAYDFRADGLCGAVLFDENIGIKGFHVAGSAQLGTGIAKVWGVETLSSIYMLLEDVGGYDVTSSLVESGAKIKDSDISLFVNQKSNIGPSKLHGAFPITREPADLNKFGPFTVKDVGKKSFNAVSKVDEDEIKFARNVVRAMIPEYTDITEAEVVKGTTKLCGLNKKSSNGYGLESDKSLYIDFEKGEYTSLMKEKLSDLNSRILNNETTLSDRVWVECLKDELRNVEKERVPRSFRICSLTNQILLKSITGSMVEQLIDNRSFTQIMVGINPFCDWPEIYSKLLKYDHKWAGDIGSFDGNMLAEVQDMVCSVIIEKYNGNNKLQLEWLLENLVRSVVVMKDDVYVTTHSMPSGCFLTAILNSLINRAYTAMWYYRNLHKKNVKVSINNFFLDVCDLVYGDDKLNGVNNHFDVLNAISMKDFFESYGMKFTDSLKKPINNEEEPLDSLTFLKRSFVYHSKLQQIVAPLDVRTLYSSLSWIDWSKDQEAVIQDKLNWFQREIYLHENLYSQDISYLKTQCLNRGVNFTILPESYLRSLYLENPEEYYTYGYLSSSGGKY